MNSRIEIARSQLFFGHRLVELSDIKPGFRVLDVGTGGGGACLIPVAKKTGERGEAIGIDIRDKAVRTTNEKLRKLGLNAKAIEMDARQMSYTDCHFDYALCGFVGFGSIYDYERKRYRQPDKSNKIMEEIYRVIKLGGGAGFSNWRNQECLETLRDLIAKQLEESGRTRNIPTGYSKEDEEGIKRLMMDVGFTNISVQVKDTDVVYKDGDEWSRYIRQSGRNIIRAAVGEKPRDIERLIRTILSKIPESHRRANTLVFTKSVIYSHGIKTTGLPDVDGKPTVRKAAS